LFSLQLSLKTYETGIVLPQMYDSQLKTERFQSSVRRGVIRLKSEQQFVVYRSLCERAEILHRGPVKLLTPNGKITGFA